MLIAFLLILHPIKGTKFGGLDLLRNEMFKIIAMFGLINPTKIRIAGGREVNLRSLQPLALKAANSIL